MYTGRSDRKRVLNSEITNNVLLTTNMNIILYSILCLCIFMEKAKINFYYFMYYGIRYYILFISFLYMIDYAPNCLWHHSYMSQNTQNWKSFIYFSHWFHPSFSNARNIQPRFTIQCQSWKISFWCLFERLAFFLFRLHSASPLHLLTISSDSPVSMYVLKALKN